MVEQAVGRVAHRAHHGKLVVYFGQIRQQLGEVYSGQFGFDGLKDGTDVSRRVGLGVPEVKVARAALQVEQDDALGLTPAGTTLYLGFLGLRGHLEHAAEG